MDQLRGPVDRLTFDLYVAVAKVVNEDPDKTNNFVVGIFSAAAAAALIYMGSKGETEDKLRQVLHFERTFESRCTPEKIAVAFRQAVAHLSKRPDHLWPLQEEVLNSGLQVYLANKAFFRRGTKVYDQFVSNTKLAFGDYVEELEDLNTADEDVDTIRKKINNWVNKQTDGKVQELLEPMTFEKSVEQMIHMWIANTCCMRAIWASPFEKIFKSDFFLTNGNTVNVEMMQITESFAYLEDDELGIQYIEIPFMLNEAALCIMLPRIEKSLLPFGYKKRQLADVEKALNYHSFVHLSMQKRFRTVDLILPKFRIDNTFDLKELFMSIGLRSFLENDADLSGIAVEHNFHLSGAFHKTTVEFNEKGSMVCQAELKSEVTLNVPRSFRDRRSSIPDVFQFHANRPFMFIVRHNMSGLILFAGRVMEPHITTATSHLSTLGGKSRSGRSTDPLTGPRSPLLSRRDPSKSPIGSPNTRTKREHTARIIDEPSFQARYLPIADGKELKNEVQIKIHDDDARNG